MKKSSVESSAGFAGMMYFRNPDDGASTPVYLTRLNLGGEQLNVALWVLTNQRKIWRENTAAGIVPPAEAGNN